MGWNELPVELVLDIFVEAARAALLYDAAWITRLSLVSRATYHAVTPVLYETLVITDHNIKLMACFTEDGRLISHVRKVYIRSELLFGVLWSGHSDVAVALGRATIHTFDVISIRQLETSFRPRRLHLRESTLEEAGMRPDLFASVTHLSVAYQKRHGFSAFAFTMSTLFQEAMSSPHTRATSTNRPAAPIISPKASTASPTTPITSLFDTMFEPPVSSHLPAASPDSATRARTAPSYPLLGVFPALTHLSLDVGRLDTAPLDEGLHDLLLTLLLKEDPQFFVVALHVVGHWDHVASLIEPIRDPRMRVWFDRRAVATLDEALDLRVRDVCAGRDVWTEAQQLHLDD